MILMKAYRDINGEIVYVEEGSFQDLDSIEGSLIRVPGLDFNVSTDLQNNLDLDAKVDSTDIIDDDTFASASDSTIPTSESVKAYVDSQIDTKDEASEITYDNTTSGLAATDTQGAIDEIDSSIDSNTAAIASNTTNITSNDADIATNASDIATNSTAIGVNAASSAANAVNIASNDSDITELQTNQADLVSLSGVAENDSDLGTFTGSTISDGNTVKGSLQELETAVDALPTGESTVSLNTTTNIFTHTSNAGTPTDIDLTLYLDDTNLARIVNGILDAGTGIATFTRDDATTFTLDLSSLIDNQDASEVPYDNTASELAATDVQSAIDENDARLDVLELSTIKEYFSANQTVAQTGIVGVDVGVRFDNEALNSNAAAFSLNTATGVITVNKASDYKIDYVVTADTQDGARRTSETTMLINGVAVSNALASATAYGYHRNNASGENSASGQALLSLSVGDTISLSIKRLNTVGTIQTVPTGTSIIIEEK